MTDVNVQFLQSSLAVDFTSPTIEVQMPALQGPAGAPGAGAPTEFDFSQPASLWTINHNKGRFPIVELISNGGIRMFASVLHVSINQVQVSFATPTAGRAILS